MKNKILTIMTSLLVLTLALTVATPVKAETTDYAKVEIVNGADGAKVTGTVTGDQTADVTVTVNEADLKWVKADPEVGRNVDGYWIGIKVTAPEGIDKDKSKMTRDVNVTKTFDQIKDDDTYAGLWTRVNENKLAAATDELVLQEYEFSWVKTGENETATKQNITVKVKKDAVKLDKTTDVVTVKIGDKTFTLTKGNSLENLTANEKTVLAELKKAPKGKVYVSLVDKDGKEFKENTPITEDIELTVKFKNAPVAAEEDEKDDTANTGVENVYAVAGLIAVVTLAGAIVLNKRK